MDISSIDARFDAANLIITVNFATPIQSPSTDAPNSVFGSIWLDTDQDTATGWDLFGLGAEFLVDVGAEALTPGQVDVVDLDDFSVQQAPISFSFAGTSFTVTVSLTLIGDDDGLVDYIVFVEALDSSSGYTEITDMAPNEGAATSEAASAPVVVITPSPTATPSPAPTPSELPETGGQPADASGVPWVAAAMGALLVACGAAALALRRRASAV